MCGENITCPTFADDNAPVCFHKSGLNALLDLAYRYKNKWRFEFNISKSLYMVWGTDKEPSLQVNLGMSELLQSVSVKHMGIHLTSDPKLIKDIYIERVIKGKNVFYASRGVGSYNLPVPPTVLSKIYWSVAIPSMTYGMEVTPINETGIELMERAHREIAKSAQMLPRNVSNPLPLAPIGWLSISTYIDLKKLCFLFKILCMPDNIYRKVTVQLIKHDMLNKESIVKGSPVNDILRVTLKYKLNDFVLRACDGIHNMSYNRIKTELKKLIWNFEINRWKSSCFLYRGIEIYSTNVKSIEMHAWWWAAHESPHLVRKFAVILSILMSSQPVGMQYDLGKSHCSLCDTHNKPDAFHCIFECNPLKEVSQKELHHIKQCMPSGMQIDFDKMTASKKLDFLLSGFNVKYTREWKQLYETVAKSLTNVYKMRSHLFESNLGLKLFSSFF